MCQNTLQTVYIYRQSLFITVVMTKTHFIKWYAIELCTEICAHLM